MGVEFMVCDKCGNTFPDCGTYIYCEKGHKLCTSCFPNNKDYWPEDQQTENDDYGDCVMKEYCPVCNSGGSKREQLDTAVELLVKWRMFYDNITSEPPLVDTSKFLQTISSKV